MTTPLAQLMTYAQFAAAIGAARAALSGRTEPDESDREAVFEAVVRDAGDRVEAEKLVFEHATVLDGALSLGVTLGAIQRVRGVVMCSTPGCAHPIDTATCADGVTRCLFCALRASLDAAKAPDADEDDDNAAELAEERSNAEYYGGDAPTHRERLEKDRFEKYAEEWRVFAQARGAK